MSTSPTALFKRCSPPIWNQQTHIRNSRNTQDQYIYWQCRVEADKTNTVALWDQIKWWIRRGILDTALVVFIIIIYWLLCWLFSWLVNSFDIYKLWVMWLWWVADQLDLLTMRESNYSKNKNQLVWPIPDLFIYLLVGW